MGLAFGTPALAQAPFVSLPDVPVVTIEPDRLFSATQFGQRLTAELEARGTKLAAENRRIEAALEEEESELTALRTQTDPDAFRDMADAFDAKVQKLRAEQDEKARVLAGLTDQAQRGYLQTIAPILEGLMIQYGASVVLDRRAVFLSANASDITDAAIAQIDATLGEGAPLDEVVTALPPVPIREGSDAEETRDPDQ